MAEVKPLLKRSGIKTDLTFPLIHADIAHPGYDNEQLPYYSYAFFMGTYLKIKVIMIVMPEVSNRESTLRQVQVGTTRFEVTPVMVSTSNHGFQIKRPACRRQVWE